MYNDFYQECKEKIIAEHHKLNEFIQSIEKDLKKQIPNIKSYCENINRGIEDICNDHFRIMVAGEAKCGKSTFINAYLGCELLPTNVKQCTSSIVGIKYGDCLKMVATYADGNKKTLTNQEEIQKFLNDNAALNDKHRDIPVPLINYQLLIPYGKKGKKIPKDEIHSFMDSEQVKKANIYHKDEKETIEYKNKIEEYIQNHKSSWKNIVTKIEISYPFEDDSMKRVEIIDSPGVYALGGVEGFTNDYIKNANAIIFLKSTVGQALESTHFNEFMKNKSVARNKKALFLILTQTAKNTGKDIKTIKSEAEKQFSQFDENHLLFVDSKAELYVKLFSKCANYGEIKTLIKELRSKETLDSFVLEAKEDSDGDMESFMFNLNKLSNFKDVKKALSIYGNEAQLIAISGLFENIISAYNVCEDFLKNNISYYQQKVEGEGKFEAQIKKIKDELNNIQEEMSCRTKQLQDEYNGANGKIARIAQREADDYSTRANKINSKEDGCFNLLHDLAYEKIEKFKDLMKSIPDKLANELNQQLKKHAKGIGLSYSSINISFTAWEFEDMFEKIKKSSEKDAKIYTEVEAATCFQDARYEYCYNRDRHFSIVKKEIDTHIDTIKKIFVDFLNKAVNYIISDYIKKLKDNAYLIQEDLYKVLDDQKNEEETKMLIEVLNEHIKDIDSAINGISETKGGIDKIFYQSTH